MYSYTLAYYFLVIFALSPHPTPHFHNSAPFFFCDSLPLINNIVFWILLLVELFSDCPRDYYMLIFLPLTW